MTTTRPAGREWWCPTCEATKEGVIVTHDTPERISDTVLCPDCENVLGVVSADVTPPILAVPRNNTIV